MSCDTPGGNVKGDVEVGGMPLSPSVGIAIATLAVSKHRFRKDGIRG